MNSKYQLTQEGLSDLKEEQVRLIGRRRELATSISEARDQGDLSENSEYQFAKEEQEKNENRLVEIEDIIQKAKIIDQKVAHNLISLGSKVELINKANQKKAKYLLVGTLEANPTVGKISDESPLGLALINKTVGETISLNLPNGTVDYEVLAIN